MWWYSKPLMTRNAVPSVIVAASQPAICFARPSCADRTARTIVRELPMRTIVFRSPSGMSSWFEPSAKYVGYFQR